MEEALTPGELRKMHRQARQREARPGGRRLADRGRTFGQLVGTAKIAIQAEEEQWLNLRPLEGD